MRSGDEIWYPEPLRYVPIDLIEYESRIRLRPWAESVDDEGREEMPWAGGSSARGGGRGGSGGVSNGGPFREFSLPESWGFGMEYRSFRFVNDRIVAPHEVSQKWGINVWTPFFAEVVAEIQAARIASPKKVAENFLKNLFTPFFLMDRAFLTLELAGSLAKAPNNGWGNDIWLLFHERLVTRRSWAGGVSDLERAYCVWFAGASATSTAEKNYVQEKTAELLANPGDIDWRANQIRGLSPGQAASQIVSEAIAGKNARRVVGLNFLFGAKIPSMLEPDLYFAFEDLSQPGGTRKIALPFRVVDSLPKVM
jgi:hypothetical protein